MFPLLKQHALVRGLQLDVSLAFAWAHLGKVLTHVFLRIISFFISKFVLFFTCGLLYESLSKFANKSTLDFGVGLHNWDGHVYSLTCSLKCELVAPSL